MALSVCPSVVVGAPVAVVWDLLAYPAHWDDWTDGRVDRLDPAGPASPGQTFVVASRGLGRRWRVLFLVETVDASTHRLGLRVALPLGMRLQEHVSCAPLGPSSCRVQYG
jgi:hypothetical protein